MGKIIATHSFRGGTGKSSIVANLAACLACKGKRVCIVDTDIQSPGIHVFFGLEPADITHSLNEYLWGKCSIYDAAIDVSSPEIKAAGGKMYLVPSSMDTSDIAKIVREGYEISKLSDGFTYALKVLDLDYLLLDTHPGIGEETLLSLAISDILLIVMRPDNQDYQGTFVTLDVCKRLEVPDLFLVVNKVLQNYDFNKVKKQIEKVYGYNVAAVLPQSDNLIELESRKLLYLTQRENPFSQGIEIIASKITSA
jgi:MinD-like ATPase involved in chromosome partitioning or flagellar assembly